MSATTLTGSNSFLISQYLKERLESFIRESGQIGVERVDASETEAREVLALLQAGSLFTPRKLVIIKDVGKNAELIERIPDALSSLSEDTELIIVEPKIDGRSKLLTILKKQTLFKSFDPHRPPELAGWLVNTAKEAGGFIGRNDAEYLIERAGSNQLLLANELTKLLLYDKKITRETIDLLVEPTPRNTAFNLVSAVMTRNHQKADAIYRELKAEKVDANQIIGSLAWQLHLLATVKTAANRSVTEIAADLGVYPQQISTTRDLAGRISLAEIIRAVALLVRIDDMRKRKDVSIDDALGYFYLSV